jgi:predicted Zn-dependent protease
MRKLKEYTAQPLARYLGHSADPARYLMGDLGTDPNGFLRRLTLLNDLSHRYDSERCVEFIRQNRSSWLGWAMLINRIERGKTAEDWQLNAELCSLFEEVPGLAYMARYERATCLLKSGQIRAAQQAFVDLYKETLKQGVLPPINKYLKQALLQDEKETWRWTGLMHQAAASLAAQKQQAGIIVLAWQCRQLGDAPLADELIQIALKDLPNESRPLITWLAIGYLWQTEQYDWANTLLGSLLADEKLAQNANLWRFGAALAQKRNVETDLAAYLEKAIDIEYHQLPEVFNVEGVRYQFGLLLYHYQKLADAMRTLKVKPPPDFLPRVIRAADRWRSLDPEGGRACQDAAKVLVTLGAQEEAWEYITTAVPRDSQDATWWLAIATSWREPGETFLADRAYATAAELEPGNAQVLWTWAEYLRLNGQSTKARHLYQQLADGSWAPHYKVVQEGARQRLQGP